MKNKVFNEHACLKINWNILYVVILKNCVCNKNDIILYEQVGTSIYAYIILYTLVIVLCTNQRGAT